MPQFAPEFCHEYWLARTPRALAFSPEVDFPSWRAALEAQLRAMIGWFPERVEADLRTEFTVERAGYTETRMIFTSEPGAEVPMHLLLPPGDGPFPVMICLQGHSTGMHISLGQPKFEGDAESIAGGRDFAVQAVRQGYAAVTIEQRCFGERIERRVDPDPPITNPTCLHPTMVALLLGRTMQGERMWDVSRAIDLLEGFPHLDTTRIGCMGNSGGGTATFYTSCLEPRITAVMPSCSVCTYLDSIARIWHCPDNHLPGALQYFEMGDLAGLLAPRPLVIVAGDEDDIFPLHGVQEAFATISAIYEAAGVPDRCRLVVGRGGHRFYPEEAWPVFAEVSGWAGVLRA
jgi:dienelactone hydrolase